MDESVKMNHLKTMVSHRAKEAVAGLCYTAEMYNMAWNVPVRNIGKPQMVVNAQLKRLYSFPPKKPYEGVIDEVSENSVELRECFDTIELRGRHKLRRSSGQRHKEVNNGDENKVANSCEANEPVSTWTRCV